MKTGIYRIICSGNNRVYVGKSTDLDTRKSKHFSMLRLGNHTNRYLQRSWNKYGELSFQFYIIEECSEDILASREIFWISTLKSESRRKGFNLQVPLDQGYRHSEDTKKLMSDLGKLRTHSEETKEKLRKVGKQKGTTPEIQELIDSKKKKTFQFTMDGVFIKEWECMAEAARQLSLSNANLSATILGRYKHCGGWRWSYERDNLAPLKKRKIRDLSTYKRKK